MANQTSKELEHDGARGVPTSVREGVSEGGAAVGGRGPGGDGEDRGEGVGDGDADRGGAEDEGYRDAELLAGGDGKHSPKV